MRRDETYRYSNQEARDMEDELAKPWNRDGSPQPSAPVPRIPRNISEELVRDARDSD